MRDCATISHMACRIDPTDRLFLAHLPKGPLRGVIHAPKYDVERFSQEVKSRLIDVKQAHFQKTHHTFCPPFYLPHLQKKSPLNLSTLFCEYPIYPIDEPPLDQRLLQEVFGKRPIKGRLFCRADGYHYLKLLSYPLHKLSQKIPTEALQAIASSPHGIHISVILPDEMPKERLAEVGEEFYISLSTVKKIRSEQGTLFVIEVESTSLLNLRRRYRLPDKVQGHPFYLPLGIQKRKLILPHTTPSYRVNPGMQEA